MKMSYKPLVFAALLATQACALMQPSLYQQQKENSGLVTQVIHSLKFNPDTSIKRYGCSTNYTWSGRSADAKSSFRVEYKGKNRLCLSLPDLPDVLEVSRVGSNGQRRDFTDFGADGLGGIDTSTTLDAANTFIFGQYRTGFEVKDSKSMDRITEKEQKKEMADYIEILKQILPALVGKGI